MATRKAEHVVALILAILGTACASTEEQADSTVRSDAAPGRVTPQDLHDGDATDPDLAGPHDAAGPAMSLPRTRAARAIAAADEAAFARFSELASFAGAGVPEPGSALIGRNRIWGELFSPRFQVGAGFAVRIAAAAGQQEALRRAFAAVEVGLRDQAPDGSLPSRVPDFVGMGAQPGSADAASAVAFFLQDACPALLALDVADPAGELISVGERNTVIVGLGAAVSWLETQTVLLEEVDATAPNRLLHDGLAFQACGLLTRMPSAFKLAERFVDLALAFTREDGVLVEAGGADTSYQAVSIEQMLGLVLAQYDDSDGRLSTVLETGLRWLEGKVGADGRVDSTGNTRTCGGCEVFLPGDPPKEVSVSAVIRALAYGSVVQGIIEEDAADRFIGWLRTAPETSCFEDDGNGGLGPTTC
ncbi:MAG: hypothetical protein AAF851_16960 [Myxococcota bacterium]